MSRPAFEAFLARLYVDGEFRAAFLADPRGAAAALEEDEVAALVAIDRHGLALAAASFERKRARRRTAPRPPLGARMSAPWSRLLRWLLRAPSRPGRPRSSC
jgi:hypothetical protein